MPQSTVPLNTLPEGCIFVLHQNTSVYAVPPTGNVCYVVIARPNDRFEYPGMAFTNGWFAGDVRHFHTTETWREVTPCTCRNHNGNFAYHDVGNPNT